MTRINTTIMNIYAESELLVHRHSQTLSLSLSLSHTHTHTHTHTHIHTSTHGGKATQDGKEERAKRTRGRPEDGHPGRQSLQVSRVRNGSLANQLRFLAKKSAWQGVKKLCIHAAGRVGQQTKGIEHVRCMTSCPSLRLSPSFKFGLMLLRTSTIQSAHLLLHSEMKLVAVRELKGRVC